VADAGQILNGVGQGTDASFVFQAADLEEQGLHHVSFGFALKRRFGSDSFEKFADCKIAAVDRKFALKTATAWGANILRA